MPVLLHGPLVTFPLNSLLADDDLVATLLVTLLSYYIVGTVVNHVAAAVVLQLNEHAVVIQEVEEEERRSEVVELNLGSDYLKLFNLQKLLARDLNVLNPMGDVVFYDVFLDF